MCFSHAGQRLDITERLYSLNESLNEQNTSMKKECHVPRVIEHSWNTHPPSFPYFSPHLAPFCSLWAPSPYRWYEEPLQCWSLLSFRKRTCILIGKQAHKENGIRCLIKSFKVAIAFSCLMRLILLLERHYGEAMFSFGCGFGMNSDRTHFSVCGKGHVWDWPLTAGIDI